MYIFIDKGNKTGRGKVTWQFYDLMDGFLGYKGSVKPQDNLLSSSFTNDEEQSTSSDPPEYNDTGFPTTVNENSNKNDNKKDSPKTKMPKWVTYFSTKIESQQQNIIEKFQETETKKLDEIKEIEKRKIDLLQKILDKMD